MRRPAIITICGSRKFKNEVELVKDVIQSEGDVVLTPMFDVDLHLDETPKLIGSIRCIHDIKMTASDFIIVVAINGYYGDDTKREIEFAESMKMPVLRLVDIRDLYNGDSEFRIALNKFKNQIGEM